MFDREFYELIGSMMAKSVKKRTRKAAKAKKCIRKDCHDPAEPGRRDVCKKHWNQFDYGRRLAKAKGPAALRKYEREEVADGRIGPSHRGCSCKNDYKARVIGATA